MSGPEDQKVTASIEELATQADAPLPSTQVECPAPSNEPATCPAQSEVASETPVAEQEPTNAEVKGESELPPAESLQKTEELAPAPETEAQGANEGIPTQIDAKEANEGKEGVPVPAEPSGPQNAEEAKEENLPAEAQEATEKAEKGEAAATVAERSIGVDLKKKSAIFLVDSPSKRVKVIEP